MRVHSQNLGKEKKKKILLQMPGTRQGQQAAFGQAGRHVGAAFYPATVCVPSKLAFDRLDFINHSSGRWMSKIIICSKVPR